MNQEIEKVGSILEEYSEFKRYGEVTIKFENGKIVVVKVTESIKL